MAVLSSGDRLLCRNQIMDEANVDHLLLGIDKPALAAAVAAIDQWIDDNATAFNQAIPQPARSALSAKQKARLFFVIVRRRFQVTNGS